MFLCFRANQPLYLILFPLRHLGVIISPVIVLFQQKEVVFSVLCCVGKIYPIRIAVLNSLCETSDLTSSYLRKTALYVAIISKGTIYFLKTNIIIIQLIIIICIKCVQYYICNARSA